MVKMSSTTSSFHISIRDLRVTRHIHLTYLLQGQKETLERHWTAEVDAWNISPYRFSSARHRTLCWSQGGRTRKWVNILFDGTAQKTFKAWTCFMAESLVPSAENVRPLSHIPELWCIYTAYENSPEASFCADKKGSRYNWKHWWGMLISLKLELIFNVMFR